MSLSIEVEPQMVAGGVGYILAVNGHLYNNTKAPLTVSMVGAVVELLNAKHAVVDDLTERLP